MTQTPENTTMKGEAGRTLDQILSHMVQNLYLRDSESRGYRHGDWTYSLKYLEP